jgi:hypothetical protein
MDEGSVDLTVALTSLCRKCRLYTIKERGHPDIPVHYVIKFPTSISKFPYVDIYGAWNKQDLLQFWEEDGYTNLYLEEEIPWSAKFKPPQRGGAKV